MTAGGKRQIREVASGSSYLSQSDLRQHFGLGKETKIDSLEIRWPGGQVEKAAAIDADQFLTVKEGSGIIKAERYGKK